MGYTQNCEIWHGASLGTLIMIHKKQFEGPCEDHVFAMKGPYSGHLQEKGTIGYNNNFKIWHGSSHGTMIEIQEGPIIGPCEDHVLAIRGQCFGHFQERGLKDTPSNVKFGMEHPWAH